MLVNEQESLLGVGQIQPSQRRAAIESFPLSEDFGDLTSVAELQRLDPELTSLRENKFKSRHVSLRSLFASMALALLPTVTCLGWVTYPHFKAPFGSGLSFAFNEPVWQTLNWHPLLMVFAFGTCFNLASVSYKIFPFKHLTQKYIHFALQTVALVSATLALLAVIFFKRAQQDYNFYSAHSYLGLATFAGFLLQYIVGYAAFAFPTPTVPWLSLRSRMSFVSWHTVFGFLLLAGTTATICTGVQDRQWLYDKYQVPGLDDSAYIYQPGFVLTNAVALATVCSVAGIMLHHRRGSARVLGRVGDVQTVAYDDVDTHEKVNASAAATGQQQKMAHHYSGFLDRTNSAHF